MGSLAKGCYSRLHIRSFDHRVFIMVWFGECNDVFLGFLGGMI